MCTRSCASIGHHFTSVILKEHLGIQENVEAVYATLSENALRMATELADAPPTAASPASLTNGLAAANGGSSSDGASPSGNGALTDGTEASASGWIEVNGWDFAHDLINSVVMKVRRSFTLRCCTLSDCAR